MSAAPGRPAAISAARGTSAGSCRVTVRRSPARSAFSCRAVPSAMIAALVDDDDAFGHRVGLVQVVGGQEQGRAVVGAQPAGCGTRSRRGWRGRGRWRVRPGTAGAGGSSGRARCPGGGAGRPTGSRACGRTGRPSRPRRGVPRRGPAPRCGHAVAAALGDQLVADAEGLPGAVLLADVADPGAHRRALGGDRRARRPGRCRRWAGAGRSACAGRSTCPRRWGRGRRRAGRVPRPGRRRAPPRRWSSS